MAEETVEPSVEESVEEEALNVVVEGSWPRLLMVRADDGEDRLRNVPFVYLFRFLEGNVREVTEVTHRGERVVLVEVASREASLRLQGLKSLCGCTATVTFHGVALLQERNWVISS
jgi:hypothetical protein